MFRVAHLHDISEVCVLIIFTDIICSSTATWLLEFRVDLLTSCMWNKHIEYTFSAHLDQATDACVTNLLLLLTFSVTQYGRSHSTTVDCC